MLERSARTPACPAAHHLAPGRAARPRGVRVRRLARRRPASRWWQVLPLGPPDRHRSPYKARSAFAAWPRAARRPARAGHRGRGARLPRAPGLLDRGLGARSPAGGRARRPGPLRARVVARCARYAGERGRAPDRRPADLRRARRAPTTAPTRSSSRRASSPAPRPTRSRDTGSCGATRCTTGRRCAGAATAGGSSACGARSRCSTWPGIDHFRGFVAYWAVPAGARTRAAGVWRRGPGRALFDAVAARARGSAAARRRGPRRDHAAGRAAARRARAPRHARAPVRLRPRRAASPHRSRTTSSDRIVYTGTHDHDTARGWYDALEPGSPRVMVAASPALDRRARAVVGTDPARVHLAGSRSRSSRPRTCSASGREARMNTRARRRELALADGRGALTTALARRGAWPPLTKQAGAVALTFAWR